MQVPAGGTGSALAEVEFRSGSREIQSTFLRYSGEGGVREPFHDGGKVGQKKVCIHRKIVT